MSIEQAGGIEVVRFSELEPLSKHPADTLLERYKRDRYSVIGRSNEKPDGAPGSRAAVDINFGYLRCAPGKGNGSHHHADWEVFIPLTGRWEMIIEGGALDEPGRLVLGPWDMIVIPPDTFHAATNISDEEGWLMSINPGAKGAAYTLHPQLIEELREQAEAIREAAFHGLDV